MSQHTSVYLAVTSELSEKIQVVALARKIYWASGSKKVNHLNENFLILRLLHGRKVLQATSILHKPHIIVSPIDFVACL